MQNDKGSLGSKFESFGAAPSEGLWDSIAGSLDEKKKRRVAIWWWLGAAAVTLAAVGIILTNTSNQDLTADNAILSPSENQNNAQVDPNLVLNNNDTINNKEPWVPTLNGNDESISEQNVNNSTAQNSDALANDNVPANEANNGSQNGNQNEDGISNNEDTNQLKEGSQDQQDAIVQRDELKDNQEEDNSNGTDRNDPIYEENDNLINPVILLTADRLNQLPPRKLNFTYGINTLTPITAQKLPRHRWELGFGVNSFRSLQAKSEYDLAEPTVDPTDDTTIAVNDLLVEINQNYSVSVTRPIGLQFHSGYQLTRRLKIVSGLSAEYRSYQYVKETEFGGINNVSSLTTIAVIPAKLTSIAIPIGLEFDFIKRRRFQMGISVSLLNEFPILETYRPDYDANYAGTQSNNRSFISGYNLGFNFNLNASVHLTDRMRIQASPTVRYYSAQKSTSTLYLPKRNFWFGGSVGLIWSLKK
ncbi:MAG: hypothetical protein ACI8ZM_002412 [Crocinitomix sp.]|jgi:hypothetical protein